MRIQSIICLFILLGSVNLRAQELLKNDMPGKSAQEMVVERQRPSEWGDLIFGGRFMDRFLPMPDLGGITTQTWGASTVIPRDVKNGIEAPEWSYWGGNTLFGADGKYHLLVCRWPESAEKGHMAYHNSVVVHATSDTPYGPFKVLNEIGPGHNPTWYVTENGKYVLYVIGACYVADNLNGPWTKTNYTFDIRDREKESSGNYLHNLTFAKREDGSFLMVNRKGDIWFSKDGLAIWNRVTQSNVYPPVEGKYEDPLVWRDSVQYHLIVNDWLGRIAWYLRSKNGVDWKVEPGEAYMPGITHYKNGLKEDWHKYERIRILQDEKGRAIAANFAVIDTLKYEDLPNDNHSSKLVVVPLVKDKLLTLLDEHKITLKTKEIKLKIAAETDFDPHTDINLESLRFGASEQVNFGKGSELSRTEKSGKDLILVFDGRNNGLTDDNFAGKLLGKDKNGQLLFGYVRLPEVKYVEPILSARAPVFAKTANGYNVEVKVSNFGQVASKDAKIQLTTVEHGKEHFIASGEVPALNPFQEITVSLSSKIAFRKGASYSIKSTITAEELTPVVFTKTITIHE